MTMPNFLLIGAPKAGTTSLYRYLSEHPQIYMSPMKAPNFFALEGEALNYQGPRDHTKNYITDLKNYCSLFDGVVNETAIGEASPWYLYMPKSSERIHHYIPNVKLIAVLRNPVDRAYSQFLSHVQRDFEPLNDFAQALDAEKDRIEDNWSPRWFYKERGFYYRQLKPYFDRFDSSQIRVFVYEDIREDYSKVLASIFEFLEVKKDFKPNLSQKYNTTKSHKNRKLFRFFSGKNSLKSALRPFFTPSQRTRIVSTLMQLNTGPKTKLSSELRDRLISEYREDILGLQDLIQRDLSCWLTLDAKK